ncbi:MAG: hypothetical protein ACYTXA_23840 [Nostoc sp.]
MTFSLSDSTVVWPAFLTIPAIALLVILTQNMFRAFLIGSFLTQYEKPESRLHKALRIVVRNPGWVYLIA